MAGVAQRQVGCVGPGVGTPNATSLRQHQSKEKPFLTFEVVSLVPYDRNLIDLSLLSPEQVRGARGRGAEQGCGIGLGDAHGVGSALSGKPGPWLEVGAGKP